MSQSRNESVGNEKVLKLFTVLHTARMWAESHNFSATQFSTHLVKKCNEQKLNKNVQSQTLRANPFL